MMERTLYLTSCAFTDADKHICSEPNIDDYGLEEPEDEEVDDEAPPDDPEDVERDGGQLDDANLVKVGTDSAANAAKPTSDSDKKIPEHKRSTTPYMTKYERARVLGTRALQIR